MRSLGRGAAHGALRCVDGFRSPGELVGSFSGPLTYRSGSGQGFGEASVTGLKVAGVGPRRMGTEVEAMGNGTN
jgi:hypothetical protein